MLLPCTAKCTDGALLVDAQGLVEEEPKQGGEASVFTRGGGTLTAMEFALMAVLLSLKAAIATPIPVLGIVRLPAGADGADAHGPAALGFSTGTVGLLSTPHTADMAARP
jgi:hypothetical protein